MTSIRAYLELARLSNAPTVVTNVLTGTAIGVAGAGLPWAKAAGTSAAMLCLYAGGMALNDLVDSRVDALYRPSRPIPSGRISPLAAAAFTAAALLAGIVILAIQSRTALVPASLLVGVILIYDLTHKRAASAVALMGMSRALVYVTAAAAVSMLIEWRLAAPLAAALATYTIAITIIARGEDVGSIVGRRWIVPLMPIIVATPALIVRPTEVASRWIAVAAGAALIIWLVLAARNALATPPRLRSAVMKWLSGICLVDAMYLALLDRPVAAGVAAGLFLVTVAGHRVILGT